MAVGQRGKIIIENYQFRRKEDISVTRNQYSKVYKCLFKYANFNFALKAGEDGKNLIFKMATGIESEESLSNTLDNEVRFKYCKDRLLIMRHSGARPHRSA